MSFDQWNKNRNYTYYYWSYQLKSIWPHNSLGTSLQWQIGFSDDKLVVKAWTYMVKSAAHWN